MEANYQSLAAIFILLALAVAVSFIPAAIAHRKGYSFWLWFLYGSVFSFIAIIHSLLLRPTLRSKDRLSEEEGLEKCPFCAEYIRPEATICRYCQNPLHRTSDSMSGAQPIDQPGLRILTVQPGSHAESAGLRRGDYLLAIDGEVISSLDDLVLQADKLSPEKEIEIGIIREGEPLYLSFRGGQLEITVSEPLA